MLLFTSIYSEAFAEVPADTLEELGVREVLRTPADGVDRNTWISWNTARLAVATSLEDMGNGIEQQDQIVIQNADGKGNSIAFGTETLKDNRVEVATVSGWHKEARATLDEEQSAAFHDLVELSKQSGPRQY